MAGNRYINVKDMMLFVKGIPSTTGYVAVAEVTSVKFGAEKEPVKVRTGNTVGAELNFNGFASYSASFEAYISTDTTYTAAYKQMVAAFKANTELEFVMVPLKSTHGIVAGTVSQPAASTTTVDKTLEGWYMKAMVASWDFDGSYTSSESLKYNAKLNVTSDIDFLVNPAAIV